jgi:hypothetical protein
MGVTLKIRIFPKNEFEELIQLTLVLLCKSDLRTKNSVLLFGQNFQ